MSGQGNSRPPNQEVDKAELEYFRFRLAADTSLHDVKDHLRKATVTLSDIVNRTKEKHWRDRLRPNKLLYFELRVALEEASAGLFKWETGQKWGIWSREQRRSLETRANRLRVLISQLKLRPYLDPSLGGRRIEPRRLKGILVWPSKKIEDPNWSPSSSNSSSESDSSSVSSSDEEQPPLKKVCREDAVKGEKGSGKRPQKQTL